MKKNGGNSFTILEQVPAPEAMLSVKNIVAEVLKHKKENEERIKLAEEREAMRREAEKAKRKQRELAKAKNLLEQEGLISALDIIGKDH